MIEIKTYDCNRIISLSDGIFSISTTLTILETLPSNLGTRILEEGSYHVFKEMLPSLTGVIFTFMIVAIYWLGHHRVFSYLKKVDPRFIKINLFFLMLIALMPFAIKISGGHSHDTFSVCFYSLYMATTGFLLHHIWKYALDHNHLMTNILDLKEAKYNLIRSLVPPSIFVLSALISLIAPVWGRYSWFILIFNGKITEWVLNWRLKNSAET